MVQKLYLPRLDPTVPALYTKDQLPEPQSVTRPHDPSLLAHQNSRRKHQSKQLGAGMRGGKTGGRSSGLGGRQQREG